MNKFLFVLLSILLFVSCKNPKTDENRKPIWNMLHIKAHGEIIAVDLMKDTCYYYESDPKFSADAELPKRFILSKAERESLFVLAEDAIRNPVYPNQFVSNYGDFVDIILSEKNISIECNYRSVSSWTSISSTLDKINQKTFVKAYSLFGEPH